MTYYAHDDDPPPPPPYKRHPEYRSIKFVLCSYIDPGCINGIENISEVFKLKDIDEIRNYFLEEIKQN